MAKDWEARRQAVQALGRLPLARGNARAVEPLGPRETPQNPETPMAFCVPEILIIRLYPTGSHNKAIMLRIFRFGNVAPPFTELLYPELEAAFHSELYA